MAGLGVIASAAGSLSNISNVITDRAGMISFTDGEMLLMGKSPNEFIFRLATAAYQTLERSVEYRWEAQQRIGERPIHQYMGIGEDSITLSGSIYPFYNQGYGLLRFVTGSVGDHLVEKLRTTYAEQGTPFQLITGRGKLLGRWVIRSIKESQSVITLNGTPRKQDFDIVLLRYGLDDESLAQKFWDTGKQKAIINQLTRAGLRRIALLTRKVTLPSINGL